MCHTIALSKKREKHVTSSPSRSIEGAEGQSAWLGVDDERRRGPGRGVRRGPRGKGGGLARKRCVAYLDPRREAPSGVPARASISPPTSESTRRPLFLKARGPSTRSPRASAGAVDPDRAPDTPLRARSPALTRVLTPPTRPDHAQAPTRTRRMRFSARRWWPPREADTPRWSPCCSRKTSIPIDGASGTRP